MESRWLTTVECVEKLKEWEIMSQIGVAKEHIKRMAVAVKYCDDGWIRMKNRGPLWWVHISKQMREIDMQRVICYLKLWGFTRYAALQSKYIYGSMQPKLNVVKAVGQVVVDQYGKSKLKEVTGHMLAKEMSKALMFGESNKKYTMGGIVSGYEGITLKKSILG